MVDRYRIIILPRASSDIAGIFKYIETASPQNAVGVATRLIESIDSLIEFPQRFKIHRSHRDRDSVVHAMSAPPFIIYYRALARERAVIILTIRHGAQRQPKRF